MKEAADLTDRFFLYVKKTDHCWLWTGHKNKGGYGRMFVAKINGKNKIALAHRISWEIHRGKIEIAPGYQGFSAILHQCRNKACVNPDHLFVGTLHTVSTEAFLNGKPEPTRPKETYSKKTHCKYGHSLADAYSDSKCRTCHKEACKKRIAKLFRLGIFTKENRNAYAREKYHARRSAKS